MFSECHGKRECWAISAPMQITRYLRPTVKVPLVIGHTCLALSNDEIIQEVFQSLNYSKIEANVTIKGLTRIQWYSQLNFWAINSVSFSSVNNVQPKPKLWGSCTLSQGARLLRLPSSLKPTILWRQFIQELNSGRSWTFFVNHLRGNRMGLENKGNANKPGRRKQRTQNDDSEGKRNILRNNNFVITKRSVNSVL